MRAESSSFPRGGWLRTRLAVVALCLVCAAPTIAQEPDAPVVPDAAVDDVPERAAVAQELELAQALPDESEERAELVAMYTAALSALDRAAELAATAANYRDRARAAPASVSEKAAALEELQAKAAPADDAYGGWTLDALVAEETRLELDALSSKTRLDRFEARLAQFPERSAALPRERAEVEAEIARLRSDVQVEAAAEEANRLVAARRTRLAADLARALQRLTTLQVEEATFALRLEVIQKEVELARAEVQRAEAERRHVGEVVNRVRIRVAEEQANKEVDQALQSSAAFTGIVASIRTLRERTVTIARDTETVRRLVRELDEALRELEDRFDDTQARIENPSLAEATGLRLRQERRQLSAARSVAANAENVLEELSRAELDKFRLSVKLDELDDYVGLAAELRELALSERGMNPELASELAGKATAEYRDALERTLQARIAEAEALDALETLRTRYVAKIAEVEEFVAERVLWIRSADSVWAIEPRALRAELEHALAPADWVTVARGVTVGIERAPSDLQRRPWTYFGLALAVLLYVGARFRLRRMLADEADLARQRSQVSIAPTWRALVVSALIAAPLGLLLYGLAELARSVDPGVFPAAEVSITARLFALGEGLEAAALMAWVVGAFRVLTIEPGLARAHFDWPEASGRLVRRQTAWLLPLTATAAFLAHFLSNLEVGFATSSSRVAFDFELDGLAFSEGFSRIAFLVMLAGFSLFHLRVLHPSKGVLARNARTAVPNDVLTSLRRLWFALGVLVFVLLTVAVVLGYGFTARALFTRLILTVAFIVAVFVLRGVTLRWTRLVRRREAFERLRKRRDEQRAKRLAEIERRRNAGEDVEELESSGLVVEEEQVDVAALSEDVLGLVRVLTGLAAIVGVFWIWAAVLPALGIFDQVHLWQHDVLTSAIDGGASTVGTITSEWVTLANLGFALFILVMTWLAVRDLPSLLEIGLLRRLELGSGERYAITTLLRYTLTMIGVVWGFNELGLSWSKLQWLVAGISVGLGFGLQEIFANFVSGITLLFERPVRVGDWVTLGDIEGVVSRIRIRATTIRDRELKELIVPNREFITGRFINWTLSDPVSRVSITVGIAYGSDTEKAIQLMLEAGRACPHSVAEPSPNVVFKSFGESSLEFELRVFVAGREIMPRVRHDLHMRVDAAFRAAEIEIAFPQRDIHVRSADGWPRSPEASK